MSNLNITGVRTSIQSLTEIKAKLARQRSEAEAAEAEAQRRLIDLRAIEGFVDMELAGFQQMLAAMEAAEEAEH